MSWIMKTGGSAFPTDSDRADRTGMTLRDYFAAKAMQSLLVDGSLSTYKGIAKEAYLIADELLKVRAEKDDR